MSATPQGRWQSTGTGKLRLVPDAEPTADEQERAAATWAAITTSRQAPAVSVWNPASAVQAAGREVSSKRAWEEIKKRRGWIEVGQSDVDNGSGDVRLEADYTKEKAREAAFARALDTAKRKLATGEIANTGSGAPRHDAPPPPPSGLRKQAVTEVEPDGAHVTYGAQEKLVSKGELIMWAKDRIVQKALSRDAARGR